MKILFFINVVPPQYGGGFLRVFKIASRFKCYGLLFKIITYTPKDVYREIMGIASHDCVFLRNKVFSTFTLIYYLIVNRKKFDVLYIASTQWYTVMPTFICKLLGKKVVAGITLSMVDSPAAPVDGWLKSLYYKVKNSQFRQADYLFVNSPLLYEECLGCGFSEKKVKLINNPVDTGVFHPVVEQEKKLLEKELGIDDTAETFLFVGSINRRKGADLFPEIFERLFKRFARKINFIICGQDGYPESQEIIDGIRNVFNENGSMFILKREVQDVHKYYKVADVFIFPTTNEGMPNVVLEAMASGCMIVCNTLPGITDYSLSKEFLVNDNDVDEYVDRIIDFEANKCSYKNLIAKNIEIIKQDFSIEKVDGTIKSILIQ